MWYGNPGDGSGWPIQLPENLARDKERKASVSYLDKTLTCRDCGQTFIFSAGEQEFYATKGFQNEPARCPECRRIRRNRMSLLSSGPRQMFPVICAQCGVETEVPFQPRGDRPVYCRACFDAMRQATPTPTA